MRATVKLDQRKRRPVRTEVPILMQHIHARDNQMLALGDAQIVREAPGIAVDAVKVLVVDGETADALIATINRQIFDRAVRRGLVGNINELRVTNSLAAV